MKTSKSFNRVFASFSPFVGVWFCFLFAAASVDSIYAQSANPGSLTTVNRLGSADENGQEESYFKNIYRNFQASYRLGPGDEIAIRVLGQPDYSFPKLKVSPVGLVYHPLVGDIEVVGLTVSQLQKKLTSDFSEYVINPKVTVSLEEALSAKVGVLGEVRSPAILVISRPTTILEAINSTGGFLDTANRSEVVLMRQGSDGRLEKRNINIKKFLEGKAGPEENVVLRAGDTVVVNGNLKKKVSTTMTSLGFVRFLSFVVFGTGI